MPFGQLSCLVKICKGTLHQLSSIYILIDNLFTDLFNKCGSGEKVGRNRPSLRRSFPLVTQTPFTAFTQGVSLWLPLNPPTFFARLFEPAKRGELPPGNFPLDLWGGNFSKGGNFSMWGKSSKIFPVSPLPHLLNKLVNNWTTSIYILLSCVSENPTLPLYAAFKDFFSWHSSQHENRFPCWCGILKIIPIGILTYAGMKTGFHTDIGPKNRFSYWHWLECQLE